MPKRETHKNTANIITSSRILLSLILIFLPVFSPWFFAIYIAAGFSDMIDGTIARKTGSESSFGAKLDSIADFIFVIVVALKILPVVKLDLFIWIWIGVIAAVKIFAAILSIRKKQATDFHTIANKITGFLLFIWPFTFSIVDVKWSTVVVCVAATIAGIMELINQRKRK